MSEQGTTKAPAPLFSKTVSEGGKTYFFDIAEAKNGNKYLRITESRKQGDEYIRKDMTLFPAQVEKFKEAFEESVGQLA